MLSQWSGTQRNSEGFRVFTAARRDPLLELVEAAGDLVVAASGSRRRRLDGVRKNAWQTPDFLGESVHTPHQDGGSPLRAASRRGRLSPSSLIPCAASSATASRRFFAILRRRSFFCSISLLLSSILRLQMLLLLLCDRTSSTLPQALHSFRASWSLWLNSSRSFSVLAMVSEAISCRSWRSFRVFLRILFSERKRSERCLEQYPESQRQGANLRVRSRPRRRCSTTHEELPERSLPRPTGPCAEPSDTEQSRQLRPSRSGWHSRIFPWPCQERTSASSARRSSFGTSARSCRPSAVVAPA